MSEHIEDSSNEKPLEDMRLSEIRSSTADELFAKFVKLRPEKRMNITTAYCHARALSDKEMTNEEAKLEYLKEAGRNDRALTKVDGAGSDEGDSGCFHKPQE